MTLSDSIPLYQEISQKLLEQITSGVYKKGDNLPTEEALTQQYHVSRVTIRQAIQLLANEGYVQKKQGSGTKVTFSKYSVFLERSAKIISFSEEMRLQGKTSSSRLLSFELLASSPMTASELNLPADTPFFSYERLLLADDMPYCLENGFLPANVFSDFSPHDLASSKFNYYRQRGISIYSSHQTVHAILPDKKTAELLNISRRKPILKINNITFKSNQKPLDKTIMQFDSELYTAGFVKYNSPLRSSVSSIPSE